MKKNEITTRDLRGEYRTLLVADGEYRLWHIMNITESGVTYVYRVTNVKELLLMEDSLSACLRLINEI